MTITSTMPLPAQPGMAVLPMCSTFAQGAARSMSPATTPATSIAARSYSTYPAPEFEYGRIGDLCVMCASVVANARVALHPSFPPWLVAGIVTRILAVPARAANHHGVHVFPCGATPGRQHRECGRGADRAGPAESREDGRCAGGRRESDRPPGGFARRRGVRRTGAPARRLRIADRRPRPRRDLAHPGADGVRHRGPLRPGDAAHAHAHALLPFPARIEPARA